MMKYINKIIVLFLITIGLFSCDENENFEILAAQENFEIVTPSSGTVIVLNDVNLTNEALFISWEDSSGQGTTYTVEAAKTGTDFANLATMGTSDGTDFSMTVDELNSFLLDVLDLEIEKATSIDIRIVGSTMVTNPISVIISPYEVEYTEFYLVGSLTNWTPAEALAMTNTGFNTFEITVDLIEGDEFKFLPTNTGWDGDWGKDPDNEGMLIVEGEQNLDGFGDGKFKISIDLVLLTYTVEEILPPATLYMVGAGVPDAGWGWDSPVEMALIEDGVFRVTTNFANEAFRFFSVNGDWGSGSNYPFYANDGYTIDAGFEDALDGDNNFRFVGTPGEYTITLNTNDKTITLTAPGPKYIVGAGVPNAGWGWDSPIVMEQISAGVWEATTNFSNDAFRFFDVNGDWGSGSNYPFYANAGYTIDANLEDAFDGDNNFKFIGTPGEFTITLDSNNKTIVLTEPVSIPFNIAVPGNHQGWSPETAPLLAASDIGKTDYEGYVWLDGGHKFIAPNDGGVFTWGNIDWGDDGTDTGKLAEQNESDIIAAAGYYFIQADTNALTYSETSVSWGIIGSATPDGWNSDTDLVYDADTKTLTADINLVAGQFKFRGNDEWGSFDLGSVDGNGYLQFGGDLNFEGADGNYKVVLDLSNPRAYTYTITLNN